MTENIAPIAQIDRLAREMKFGVMQLSLEVHDKKIVGISGPKFRRKKYQVDGYKSMLADMVVELEKCRDQEASGTITFTVKLHKGESKELYVQTNYRQVFDKDFPCDII
jgi:ribosomal protein L14E/L6E/L27E